METNKIPVYMQYTTLPEEFPVKYETYVQDYQPVAMIHYHNCLEIGLCLEGSGMQMISNHMYPFTANSISIIEKNCIHDAHIWTRTKEESGSVWQYIFLNPEDVGVSFEEFGGFLTNDTRLVTLFHMMYDELENRPDSWQNVFTQLLSIFMTYVKRLAPQNVCVNYAGMPPEMLKIIRKIHQSYNEKLYVSELAVECDMSVSSLGRMFRAYFNMTPLDYINNVRLNMAQYMLLNTNKQILDISLEVGFTSLSAFNRSFKKLFGISPSVMRRKKRSRMGQ